MFLQIPYFLEIDTKILMMKCWDILKMGVEVREIDKLNQP